MVKRKTIYLIITYTLLTILIGSAFLAYVPIRKVEGKPVESSLIPNQCGEYSIGSALGTHQLGGIGAETYEFWSDRFGEDKDARGEFVFIEATDINRPIYLVDTEGNSMLPSIAERNILILTKPLEPGLDKLPPDVNVGDVINFKAEDKLGIKRFYAHRVIEIVILTNDQQKQYNTNYLFAFRTKGDNNIEVDPGLRLWEDVQYKIVGIIY